MGVLAAEIEITMMLTILIVYFHTTLLFYCVEREATEKAQIAETEEDGKLSTCHVYF